MSKDPKQLVQEMVRRLGKREAERLLINARVSSSVAGKLIRGTYPSEVGELVAAAIEKAHAAAQAS